MGNQIELHRNTTWKPMFILFPTNSVSKVLKFTNNSWILLEFNFEQYIKQD